MRRQIDRPRPLRPQPRPPARRLRGRHAPPLTTPSHPSVCCIRVLRAGPPRTKHSGARNTRMGSTADGRVRQGLWQPGPMHDDGSRQGDPRCLPRQPRDRHRQVRRLRDHRLGRPARRGRPLPRRHRQPAAPAARRQAGRQGRRHRPPVRLRARALLLGLRRRPRAVLDGRAVRALRGLRQAAPPARGREPPRRHRHPPVRHAPRGPSRCAPPTRRRPPSAPTHGSWLGWIRRSKQPELPVVLLEDSGALVGLVIALVRRDPRPRDRRAALGRHRLDRHRRPARRHRHRAGRSR